MADGAQEDGAFTALRGFEWSSPMLGHIDVWFSERWTDPLHTGGVGRVRTGARSSTTASASTPRWALLSMI